MKTLRVSLLSSMVALALVACGSPEAPAPATDSVASSTAPAAQAQVIQLDGSSTVYPISEAIAEEFQMQNQGKLKVTVGVSGTGGGFKKFCRGELDIANASRPIQKSEMEICAAAGISYYELPVAFDALTVVANPKNEFLSTITVEQLKKIWAPESQGTISRWNQIDPSWPDAEFKLYGAGSDSGTFDYFTEAVVGKAKSSRGDYTASEDDNTLVQGVAQDVNALGYFGYAYYAENQDKLKALAIAPTEGAPGVLPSEEAVIAGTYVPLARPMFVYVSAKSMERPEIKQFLDFYFDNVAELAREVRYVPLPKAAYDGVRKHLAEGKVGTVFHGEPATSITIEELLEREASL
ncbi:MAG: PstS family phosphate ABC transporter substrate-binding protein [Rhodanobacteraceae bacterium]|nr:PstS family phosphate ABC transporter substrate-binding protein [Rhodanobacteraceae bacterium]